MLTRKRVIATAAGALVLSAAAAGGAWARVNPAVDRYTNDDSFGHKSAYKVSVGQDRRLVIWISGPSASMSPFKNDGNGFEKLLGVSGTPQTRGIHWAVKYGKGPHHEARLVIHFAKNFTNLTGGFTRLRYDVLTSHGVKHSYLLFKINSPCGNVSCS
jgi:hypothetical protein